ncbi:MAG: hypothetical protein SFV51_22745 [Bryobacteraceae bacterium]|nr:hypothetical protein [Bryobacteraceae bacterium]
MKVTWILLAAAAAAQQAPAPVVQQWNRQSLLQIDSEVARKASGNRPSFAVLTRTATSVAAIIHRARTGEAELHEEMADFFIVRAGSGTLVTSGKLINDRVIGKGEHAADGIEGGESRKLSTGDVAHVPSKTPHHVVVAPGETITYLLIKAKE